MSHIKQTSKGMVILTGNSHPEFAKMVAQHLGTDLGKCNVYFRSNRETKVAIGETVRGRDVYILQTGTKNVNNDIMETMIMVYACKTSDARSINVCMPYLPYCKQSKMRKRGSIVCHLVAQMLCKSGMTQLITMDLHAKEIQGFFSVPVDNLRASPFLIKYIEENLTEDRDNIVVVARNPTVLVKASSYAERLRAALAVIHGENKDEDEGGTDGRNSPPPSLKNPASNPDLKNHVWPTTKRVRNESFHSGIEYMPMMMNKSKPKMYIVGEVANKVAIMVDDLIDDVEQFVGAAELLHEEGATKIFVLATHGLLSSDAPQQLEDSYIDEVVVTNTVPHDLQKTQCNKIKTVDVTVLIAEAIRRIFHNESMSYLFMNVSKDD